jgi:hypothetical protein
VIFTNVPLARRRTAQLDRFYAQLRDGVAMMASHCQRPSPKCMRFCDEHSNKGSLGWITADPASLASPSRGRSSCTEKQTARS